MSIHKPRTSISRRSTGKNRVIESPSRGVEDASDELEQDDQAHRVSSGQRRSEGPQVPRSAAHEQSEAEMTSYEPEASPSVRETRANTTNTQSDGLAQHPKKSVESSRRVSERIATVAGGQTHGIPVQQRQTLHKTAGQHLTPVGAVQKQVRRLLKAHTSNANGSEKQVPSTLR